MLLSSDLDAARHALGLEEPKPNVTVYRIETERSGPWRGPDALEWGADARWAMDTDQRHLIAADTLDHERCGFLSPHALLLYFKSVLPDLDARGFRVAVYEAPHVRRNSDQDLLTTQCIFSARDARLVRTVRPLFLTDLITQELSNAA